MARCAPLESPARAVEEQNVTTLQIAASVQQVSSATAGAALAHVVEVAVGAGTASCDIETGVAENGREAETLRAELDDFLNAVRDDSGERRRFERIPGNGVSAALRAPGHQAIRVWLGGLSRGGLALQSPPLPVGTQVEVDLPDASGAVQGKVARAERGVVGVVFREDSTTQARVDRALQALGAMRDAA